MRNLLLSILLLFSFSCEAQYVNPTLLSRRTSHSNPSQIFGSDLKFWINTNSSANKTLSGATGFLPSITLTGVTTDDTNGWTLTDGADNLTWNGFAMGTKGGTLLQHSTLTDFKNLHDGSSYSIFFKVFILEALTTERYPLIATCEAISSDIGIQISYDNRSASSRTDAIVFLMTRGVGGQNVFNAAANNVLTKGVWHTVNITYNGTQLTMYVDEVQVFQGNDAFANSTANSSNNLTFFRNADDAATTARDVWIRHPVIVTKVASSDEIQRMNSYLNFGNDNFGSAGVANVYGMYGQSNMAGAELDYAGSPAYYDDPTGAVMYDNTANSTNSYTANNILAHEFGVNANSQDQDRPGPDVEFAYRMNLIAPNTIFLLKFGVSATSIQSSGSTDWNAAGGPLDCATSAFDEQLAYSIKLIKYHYNRNFILRGFIWRQGESDTAAPNTYYEGDFIDLVQDRFLPVMSAYGLSVAKCRLVMSSLDCYIGVRPSPGIDDFVAQQQNLADDANANFGFVAGTLISTIGCNIPTDGTHFGTAGQITHGFRIYDYLKDYITETIWVLPFGFPFRRKRRWLNDDEDLKQAA